MNTRRFALYAALILGISISGITYQLLLSASGTKDKSSDPVPMIKVVQAYGPITPGNAITSENVKEVSMPRSMVLSGSFDKVSKVQGRIVKTSIYPGEQVIQERLVPTDKSYGLAVYVPEGMRAVTIGIDEVIGVGGHLRPGDIVDVLATIKPQTSGSPKTMLLTGDVKVLAVGKSLAEDSGDKAAASVTLALKIEDAQRVALAEDSGKLKLVLHPITAEKSPEIKTVAQEDVFTPEKPASVEQEGAKQPSKIVEPPVRHAAARSIEPTVKKQEPAKVVTQPKEQPEQSTLIIYRGTEMQTLVLPER